MKKLIGVLAGLMVVGCGNPEFFKLEDAVQIQADSCVMSRPAIIQAAIATWNGAGANFTLNGRANYELPVICGMVANVGQYEPGGSITVSSDLWLSGVGLDDSNATDLLVHELGHALGLRHVQDKASVMRRFNHPASEPTLSSQDLLDLNCAQESKGCGEVEYDEDSGI